MGFGTKTARVWSPSFFCRSRLLGVVPTSRLRAFRLLKTCHLRRCREQSRPSRILGYASGLDCPCVLHLTRFEQPEKWFVGKLVLLRVAGLGVGKSSGTRLLRSLCGNMRTSRSRACGAWRRCDAPFVGSRTDGEGISRLGAMGRFAIGVQGSVVGVSPGVQNFEPC